MPFRRIDRSGFPLVTIAVIAEKIRAAILVTSVWAACLLSLSLCPRAMAEAQPSYEAIVDSDRCFALSGPGIGYYPTSLLERGTKVTVFGERSKNWISILPPPGSFSWVPARAVEILPDGTGTITIDETKVRVGSSLSDARHVFQVSLKKGTSVQILERIYASTDGEIAAWFKILPPQDEVRYVAANQLKLPGGPVAPIDQPQPATSAPSNPSQPIPSAQPLENSGGAINEPGREMGSSPLEFVGGRVIPPAKPIRPDGGSSALSSTLSNLKAEMLDGKGAGDSLIAARATLPPSDVEAPYKSPPTKLTDNPALTFDKRVTSFRNQLEMMQSLDPSLWDASNAKDISDELTKVASDAKEKQEALDVAHQVDLMVELRNRYERTLTRRNVTLKQDAELEAMQRTLEQAARQAGPQFTAQGILQESTIRVDEGKSYSLKTASGITTHIVVPVPGLNIERYIGKSVGVIGQEQKRNDLVAPVIVTEQLAPLDNGFLPNTSSMPASSMGGF